MTDTEVGFKGRISQVSSSMCIKEQQQQQQHADVTCAWSSSLVTRAQGSRGEKVNTVHPCVSSSIMAIVCHFPRDNKRIKNKT